MTHDSWVDAVEWVALLVFIGFVLWLFYRR